MHGVGKLAVLRSFAQFQNQYNEMLYKMIICIVADGMIDENICQIAHAGVRLLKVYKFFPKKDQNQTTF